MENQEDLKIALEVLQLEGSKTKMHDFTAKSMKRADTLGSAAKNRLAGLKRKTVAYDQLEKVHNIRGGSPSAARELLSSLVKPRRKQSPVRFSGGAKAKPAPAFCGHCGAKLTSGAAFCPGCGMKIG